MSDHLAGYAFLMERYAIEGLSNWHVSLIGQTGILGRRIKEEQEWTFFRKTVWPGDGTGDHLEFALKHDGVNLGILYALFSVIPAQEIADWIALRPTGKYTRRIWFLYEFLIGQELPLPSLTRGNYVSVLDPDTYYVLSPGRRSPRHRVINNLLGGSFFCPIVRKTARLVEMEGTDIEAQCESLASAYSPEMIRRTLGFLYRKETRSSFEIENIQPNASRTERFISLLSKAESKDFCEKAGLLELQNAIVDPRFCDIDYRRTQYYVGESPSQDRQRVYYISPRPQDLPKLMDGLLAAHRNMLSGNVPAVIHAAVISYGFVFLHPFEDGNGRIHRFLIHNILSLRGAVQSGFMLPVSASMLRNAELYEASLEAFSKKIKECVLYELDEDGRMTVTNDTAPLYRFIDMSAQAEGLYALIKATFHSVKEEFIFLKSHDVAKSAIQEIVDMPDRLIDLFIQCCLQNGSQLSARKRKDIFSSLTDEEVTSMENAVRSAYGDANGAGATAGSFPLS